MNYHSIYTKHEAANKKYYKVVDVRSEEGNREISTFLSTKELAERN
jgi:hypothetical protein